MTFQLAHQATMLLQDLPKTMRPREKLLSMGTTSLSDVELLAVMLGNGMPGQNVLQLSQSLLDKFQNLAGLLQAPASALKSAKGLGGSARRAQLLAVLEMAKRVLMQQMRQGDVMTNPENVQHFLQLHLAVHQHEVFAVMFLDNQNSFLGFKEMFSGTLNQTSVYPREVVKLALELGAASVILAHNHPSGQVRPSNADKHLTRTLQSALSIVDVKVLDHVIVGRGKTWSMAEEGPW